MNCPLKWELQQKTQRPHEEKGKVVQFLREMTEEEAEIAAAVEEGIADIEAGRFHTQREVEKLLSSWFAK